MNKNRHPIRTNLNRRNALVALAVSGYGANKLVTAAESWPQRPITIIVPYAPGGQGDVFARLVGERLTTQLGQPVIVENRPGASGALGARLVARAKPDGYTLLLGQTGEMAVNGSFMRQPGYDALKDFRGIAMIGEAPLVLCVPASAPYNTVAGLVSAAKAAPRGFSYASSGTATPGHLAAASLAVAAKVDLVHVPYKGAGQAMADLLGAQVQMFFPSASAVIPQVVSSGKVKALAVCSASRINALPQIPTMAEAGFPQLAFGLWGGLFAPAGTPDTVVAQLNKLVGEIVEEPSLRKRLESEGSALPRKTPAEVDAMVRRDVTHYAQVLRQTGIQAE
ncbi:tripartite tricarboxylate transporter substrate binding protein [uncultured Xylophilus sp.]|uniref:Bug family tripartite tricarboxylate transporter substrate binding protein n=1 Tax=uncultured Xylophilus sp. TaxID=296832 RepID=UPI0025CF0B7D|nr:tripartite tricarboxylate transporter substrate binding protein [uncultured Xylophilus sp.]